MVSEWYSRVYLPSGRVAHLLSGHHSPSSGWGAMCGAAPVYFGSWLGTGTYQEREKAEAMRLCKRCEEKS